MRSTAAFALALCVAQAHAVGFWCAAPRGSVAQGGEFRGQFQDFDLYVNNAAAACAFVGKHVQGNDGLWVLEFSAGSPVFEKEHARLTEEGAIAVLYRLNNSIVVAADENLTIKMGYDACGANPNMRAISVSPRALGPQKGLTAHEEQRRAAKKVDPRISQALLMINSNTLPEFIAHLQSYNSRNSNQGSELEQAAQWVGQQYTAFGFNVTRHHWSDTMAAQVVAELPGRGPNPGIIVVGAHLDSRNILLNSPTARAPGADDNGSGSAALVAIAKVLHDANIPLTHTIRIVSFTGEEQGLLGSRALASEYKEAGVELIGMINGDMIGYRRPNTPVTLGMVNRNVNLAMMEWSAEITQRYVPELEIAFSGTCCSDHQSFNENGYRSISFFENNGNYATYPHYHTSTDLLQYLDPENLMYHTRAMLASVLELAEPLDN